MVMMDPHEKRYDTYEQGVLLTIPIKTLEQALAFEEGDECDILVVADRRGYRAPIETRAIPGLLTEATPDDIATASQLMVDLISALNESSSCDDYSYFIEELEDALEDDAMPLFFDKESERTRAKEHLAQLKSRGGKVGESFCARESNCEETIVENQHEGLDGTP